VIDTVLDFDVPSFSFNTKQADRVLVRLDEKKWTLEWVLETHAHADHITAAHYFKKKTGAKVAIGEGITVAQESFKSVFNLTNLKTDGSQFDHLFKDNEEFKIGNLTCKVLHTPGHTPSCLTYYFPEECAFVGDTLFLPDSGTARCDFPSGCAKTLWSSIQRLLSLPDHVRIYVGHDYGEGGRPIKYETTIAEEKEQNKHVKTGTLEEDYVKVRTTRDSTLSVPRLLLPSIQLNIAAGRFPDAEDNGVSYMKFPIKYNF